MPKYRKKPVVIEAFQMTRDRRHGEGWPDWLERAYQLDYEECGKLRVGVVGQVPTDNFEIVTLEGIHAVSWDDFIIQGVQGELYPCKPDIFAATYEPVEGTD